MPVAYSETHPARTRVMGSAPPRKLAGRLICGAYARSTGKPCQAAGTGRGGRCRRHGGASTGPRTPEGRARCLAGWRAWLEKPGSRAALAESRRRGAAVTNARKPKGPR